MDKTEHSTESTLEQITRTVLYEGYSLYPYYRSSVKNAQPVPFGTVYPQAYKMHHPEIHASTQTECILKGTSKTELQIRVKFLHLRNRKLLKIDPEALGPGQFKPSKTLNVNGKSYHSGWEAIEREIDLGSHFIGELVEEKMTADIAFKGEQANDIIFGEDETVAGNVLINQSDISGTIAISATPVKGKKNGFRISVTITNTTPVENAKNCSRNDMYQHSLLSAHTILQTEKGHFISQTDPDAKWKKAVDLCKNINTWPILVEQNDKTMLSSPIVLYDYPEIAPESKGSMFDSTEIEEALVLHMATLPDKEKERINQGDAKMKAMLKRVESVTPEELLKLHGGFKEIQSNQNSTE